MTEQSPLNTEGMTWALLLGRWVDFARAALALPDDAEGRRLRDSVGDIIQLQAVWFALGQLDALPPDQRALGAGRAAVLVQRHAGAIERRFAGSVMPAMLRELIADARLRLAEAGG